MTEDFFDLEVDIKIGGKWFVMREGGDNLLQPYLTTEGRKVHWTFNDEIHDWFVAQGIAYELGGYRHADNYGFTYQIRFDDKAQAALFKLTFF